MNVYKINCQRTIGTAMQPHSEVVVASDEASAVAASMQYAMDNGFDCSDPLVQNLAADVIVGS